ncbi:Beta-glucosidase 29, partial [Mucuna pruriens]
MAWDEYWKLILLGVVVSILPSITFAESISSVVDVDSLNRASFPKDFIFGTASAAYQNSRSNYVEFVTYANL